MYQQGGRVHLFKIEKLVIVQGDHDDREERRWRKEVLDTLGEISAAVGRLETTLATQFEQLKEASDEQKTELANLAGAVEALIQRLSDNPTPEQVAEVVTSMRGVTDGIRAATGTVSTLDPSADAPPTPADPDA